MLSLTVFKWKQSFAERTGALRHLKLMIQKSVVALRHRETTFGNHLFIYLFCCVRIWMKKHTWQPDFDSSGKRKWRLHDGRHFPNVGIQTPSGFLHIRGGVDERQSPSFNGGRAKNISLRPNVIWLSAHIVSRRLPGSTTMTLMLTGRIRLMWGGPFGEAATWAVRVCVSDSVCRERRTSGKKLKKRQKKRCAVFQIKSSELSRHSLSSDSSTIFPTFYQGPQHLPRWHELTLPAASSGSAAMPTSKKKRFHLKPALFSNQPTTIQFACLFFFSFLLLLLLPPTCPSSVFGTECLYMHMSSRSPPDCAMEWFSRKRFNSYHRWKLTPRSANIWQLYLKKRHKNSGR